jgi:hypothetical protein
MDRITIIVRERKGPKPPNGKQQYEAYLAGELILSSHQPLLDCARALLATGRIKPTDVLGMRREGDVDDALSGQSGELAKWTTSEPDSGLPGGSYPKFVKYVSYSREPRR